MEVDSVQCTPAPASHPTASTETQNEVPVESKTEGSVEKQVATEKVVKKKKKKKASYKSMMANMTQRSKDAAAIEKEKQALRKVTGGGNFKKVDKI